MDIRLNGEPMTIQDQCTVAHALQVLGYHQEFYAIAINQVCIPKHAHGSTMIQPGDEIEVLSPMQGG